MLSVLQRDLPDHILCFYCEMLHSLQEYKKHHYRKYHGITCSTLQFFSEPDPKRKTTPYPRSLEFSSVILEMALKRHRQGVDASALELLERLPFRPRKEHYPYYNSDVQTETCSARIVEGSLLLRLQQIYYVSCATPMPILDRSRYQICSHFTFWGYAESQFRPLGNETVYRDDWADPADYRQWKGMISCKFCHTEFRIDFKVLGERKSAVYITIWKDFGEGLRRSDPIWQGHANDELRTKKRSSFMRGSICAAYEGENRVPHDEFDFGALPAP